MLMTAFLLTAANLSEPVSLQDVLRPERVCSLTSDVLIGITSNRPTPILESVRRVERDGKAIWRALHHAQDPAPNMTGGYDLSEANASDLGAIESRYTYGGRYVRFTYEAAQATARDISGAALETVALAGQKPLVRGPGDAVLVQAIDWRDGLDAIGYYVDNFSGAGDERLRDFRITVTGRSTVEHQGKQLPVYVTAWRDSAGSEIIREITIDRPHRVMSHSFRFRPDSQPRVSITTRVQTGPDCEGK